MAHSTRQCPQPFLPTTIPDAYPISVPHIAYHHTRCIPYLSTPHCLPPYPSQYRTLPTTIAEAYPISPRHTLFQYPKLPTNIAEAYPISVSDIAQQAQSIVYVSTGHRIAVA
eukprot:2268014-Rhodomonas_salina.1